MKLLWSNDLRASDNPTGIFLHSVQDLDDFRGRKGMGINFHVVQGRCYVAVIHGTQLGYEILSHPSCSGLVQCKLVDV